MFSKIFTISILLIVVCAATFNYEFQQKNNKKIATPIIYVNNFAKTLDKVNSIVVQTKQEVYTFSKSDADNWVIKERNNFPADSTRVNELLLGLMDIKVVETKTSISQKHEFLDLDWDIDKSSIIKISTLDTEGSTLESVYFGKREPLQNDNLYSDLVFLRKTSENQSWSAKINLPLSFDLPHWTKQPLLPLSLQKVDQIDINTNKSKETLSLKRELNSDGIDFEFVNLKDISKHLANQISYTIDDINFEDVVTADSVPNFQSELTVNITEKEGVNYSLQFNTVDSGKILCKVDATLNSSTAEIAQTAQAAIEPNKAKEADEKLLDKVTAMNKTNQQWYYVVNKEIFDRLNKTKQDYISEKKSSTNKA